MFIPSANTITLTEALTAYDAGQFKPVVAHPELGAMLATNLGAYQADKIIEGQPARNAWISVNITGHDGQVTLHEVQMGTSKRGTDTFAWNGPCFERRTGIALPSRQARALEAWCQLVNLVYPQGLPVEINPTGIFPEQRAAKIAANVAENAGALDALRQKLAETPALAPAPAPVPEPEPEGDIDVPF